MTKVLLVGCGAWGKYCARDLLELEVDLAVVAKSETSINNAKELGITKIYNSIAEVPHKIDAAVVVTPLNTHYSVIKDLLKKFPTIKIFCEKELTASETEAEELNEKYSSQISIMHKWCYHTGILELKKLSNRKDLGKLIGISLERHAWGNTHDSVSPVWTLLPHDFSIVHELLGYIPEIKSAVIDKPKELIHGISIIAGKTPWVKISASSHQPKRERSALLHFENGIAYLEDAMADKITVQFYPADDFNSGGIIEEINFVPNMPLFDELKEFVNYLKGEKEKPKSSVSTSLEIIRAINKAIEIAS